MRSIWLYIAALGAVAATTALAKPMPPTAEPATVQALLGCRGISDNAQRLACYDRETANVQSAISKKDLVLIDNARATEARRSLFGFSVPSFAGLLGGGDLNQVESTVAGTRENADGGWTVKLADGSVWSQVDDTPVALPPRNGDKVIVKRGTLGSYWVKVGNQPGFKAKRIG